MAQNKPDPKDPLDTRIQIVYWGDWLDGDTIAASTFTIESIPGDANPLTETSATFGSNTTTITLDGGTHGNQYRITNQITTTTTAETKRWAFPIDVRTA